MREQDEFSANEKVEILVASVRMLTIALYKALSSNDPTVLEFLISGTEKSLRDSLINMVPPKNALN